MLQVEQADSIRKWRAGGFSHLLFAGVGITAWQRIKRPDEWVRRQQTVHEPGIRRDKLAPGTEQVNCASLPPAEAGKTLVRPPSVAPALAGAQDDRASTQLGKRANSSGTMPLSEAPRIVEPVPWRNEVQTTLDRSDKAVRRTGLFPWSGD